MEVKVSEWLFFIMNHLSIPVSVQNYNMMTSDPPNLSLWAPEIFKFLLA